MWRRGSGCGAAGGCTGGRPVDAAGRGRSERGAAAVKIFLQPPPPGPHHCQARKAGGVGEEKPELSDPNRAGEARFERGEGRVARCVRGGEARAPGRARAVRTPHWRERGVATQGGRPTRGPPTLVNRRRWSITPGWVLGLTAGPRTGGAHRRTARAPAGHGALVAPDSRPPGPDAWSAVVAAHGPTGSARGRAAPLAHRYVARAHGQRRLEGFCPGLVGGGIARTSRPWRVRSGREARRLGSCGTGLDRRARAHWEQEGGETEARQSFKGARPSPPLPSRSRTGGDFPVEGAPLPRLLSRSVYRRRPHSVDHEGCTEPPRTVLGLTVDGSLCHTSCVSAGDRLNTNAGCPLVHSWIIHPAVGWGCTSRQRPNPGDQGGSKRKRACVGAVGGAHQRPRGRTLWEPPR